MNTSITTTHRMVKAVALGLVLAALAVPAALAGGNSRYGPPDPWAYRLLAANANQSSQSVPDALDRYVANQRRQADEDALDRFLRNDKAHAVPDALDRYLANQQSQSVWPDDRRGPRGASPFASVSPQAKAQAASDTSFHWGDMVFGVAGAFGVMLLVAAAALTVRRSHRRLAGV